MQTQEHALPPEQDSLFALLSGKRVRSAPKATILRCLRARPLFDFAASPRLSPRLRASASKIAFSRFPSPSTTGSSVALSSALNRISRTPSDLALPLLHRNRTPIRRLNPHILHLPARSAE